jgi:hypothetical protein
MEYSRFGWMARLAWLPSVLLILAPVACGHGGGSSSPLPPGAPVSVTVTPAPASVAAGTTYPFTATVTGTPNTSVNWRVNGVPGGNASSGTISTSGLFTAPGTVPNPATVTVTALSLADPTQSASTAVTITAGPSGPTLVVDKSGGGAYTTIQAALDKATAGTTIQVRAGTYTEFLTFPTSGSASGGYITLQGDAGAILSGNNQDVSRQQPMIAITGRSYLKVVGLEICNLTSTNKANGDPTAILVSGGGSHLEFRNNTIHHITCLADSSNGNAHGISIYGDSATAISNIVISGNQIHDNKTGWSENCTLDGNVTDFEISNNDIHDNDNIGIDISGYYGVAPSGSPDCSRNGIIYGNHVFNITSSNNPAYGTPASYGADGIYVDGGSNVIIERNTVDRCDLGIEAASENAGHASDSVWIRSNFVSRSQIANLSVGGYAAAKTGSSNHIYIYSNTTCQSAGAEVQFQYNAQNITIENNIFVQGPKGNYIGNWGTGNAAPVLDSNLYFGGSTTSSGDFLDAHPLFVNPLLVSPYADLHLQAASPAINAGLSISGTDWQGNPAAGNLDLDGAARVQGGAIDVGADEVR